MRDDCFLGNNIYGWIFLGSSRYDWVFLGDNIDSFLGNSSWSNSRFLGSAIYEWTCRRITWNRHNVVHWWSTNDFLVWWATKRIIINNYHSCVGGIKISIINWLYIVKYKILPCRRNISRTQERDSHKLVVKSNMELWWDMKRFRVQHNGSISSMVRWSIKINNQTSPGVLLLYFWSSTL